MTSLTQCIKPQPFILETPSGQHIIESFSPEHQQYKIFNNEVYERVKFGRFNPEFMDYISNTIISNNESWKWVLDHGKQPCYVRHFNPMTFEPDVILYIYLSTVNLTFYKLRYSA